MSDTIESLQGDYANAAAVIRDVHAAIDEARLPETDVGMEAPEAIRAIVAKLDAAVSRLRVCDVVVATARALLREHCGDPQDEWTARKGLEKALNAYDAHDAPTPRDPPPPCRDCASGVSGQCEEQPDRPSVTEYIDDGGRHEDCPLADDARAVATMERALLKADVSKLPRLAPDTVESLNPDDTPYDHAAHSNPDGIEE